MRKSELAFILAWRGISIRSDYKLDKLKEIAGDVSEDEKKMVFQWKTVAGSINTRKYDSYSNVELKGFFEYKTAYSFPIPISILGNKAKSLMMAYYHLKGQPLEWDDVKFTEEQESMLSPNLKGIYVVNAGPGTGKTTVANERAYRLRKQGVILISYTNAAIKENYRRMRQYPGISKIIGKKNFNKPFNVTTIDSLANWVFGNKSEDHDQIVQAAIDSLRYNPEGIEKFYIPGRGPRYKQIIVDECQDIDNLRGELIMTFFKLIPGMTLTLFGDPRQRIHDGCGEWYSDLWSTGLYKGQKVGPVNKVGFTSTYRFLNPLIMPLANKLSSRRPEIHHELIPFESKINPTAPITLIQLSEQKDENGIISVANYIRDVLHSKYHVSYENIAVIGPSLDRKNRSSEEARRILEIFRDNEIPCYTRSEGAYKPRGVLFSTIHSIKGKEFDYVFLFGMSDYPNTYSMIGYQESESLIYVAHTRARIAMYYFGWDNFIPPRGIPPESVANYEVKQQHINRRRMEPCKKQYNVDSLSQNYNFQKFLTINGYLLEEIEIKAELKDDEDIQAEKIECSRFGITGIADEEYADKIIMRKHCSPLKLQLISSLTGKPVECHLEDRSFTVQSVRSKYHWQYILPAFIQIDFHVHLVKFRQSIAIEKGLIVPKIESNTFTVDTEFYGLEMKGRSKIFDIGIINLKDPYLSIIQTTKMEGPGLKFASEWIYQPEELFKNSGTIYDVRELFEIVRHRDEDADVKLIYYMCPTDVQWYNQGKAYDMGPAVKAKALVDGYISSGSQPPRLTDFYGLVSKPLEFQPHIRPHTAISDALILYELIHLGIIRIENLNKVKSLKSKVVKEKDISVQDKEILSLLGL